MTSSTTQDSNEAGQLLYQFMEAAKVIKQEKGFSGGCLVIEGEVGSDHIFVYWRHEDGSTEKL